MYDVIFYAKEDGTEPTKEFLTDLDTKMRAKMVRTIALLQANGNLLREPYSKPLQEGIFELKAQVGTDITRVLYFFYIGRNIVLTNGFIKKSQKTPPGEIERAIAYKNDFLARKENSQ